MAAGAGNVLMVPAANVSVEANANANQDTRLGPNMMQHRSRSCESGRSSMAPGSLSEVSAYETPPEVQVTPEALLPAFLRYSRAGVYYP